MDGATLADPRPNHREVPFSIDEMFYSRTDGRGVIIAGNQVFQRVSCHSWSSLIGAPHRIIRHPVHPKGSVSHPLDDYSSRGTCRGLCLQQGRGWTVLLGPCDSPSLRRRLPVDPDQTQFAASGRESRSSMLSCVSKR